MSGKERQTKSKSHQTRTGLVRTISGDKSISVTVSTLVKNPQYGKYVRRRTKLSAHDPDNTARIGDMVELVPCRRVSKSKSWRVLRVLRRSATSE